MKFGGSRFPSMAWQGTWIGLKRWPMAEPYLLGTRWPMEAPCGAPLVHISILGHGTSFLFCFLHWWQNSKGGWHQQIHHEYPQKRTRIQTCLDQELHDKMEQSPETWYWPFWKINTLQWVGMGINWGVPQERPCMASWWSQCIQPQYPILQRRGTPFEKKNTDGGLLVYTEL